MGVSWDTSGFDRKIKTALRRLSESQRRLLLNQLAAQTESGLDENMKAKKDSGNQMWTPLSDRTIEQRRNKDKKTIKILEDTGRLRQWASKVVSGTKALVGTTVEYGIYHNYGDENLPKREWAYLNQKTQEKFTRILKRFLGVLR